MTECDILMYLFAAFSTAGGGLIFIAARVRWERWHWPFKTQAEREMIMRWMALTDLNNGTIPF